MQSVGSILKDQRQKKKFSLEDVHKFVKIHSKFLSALEEGDYSVFSDEIHAKGFLKNYAEFLELDVEKLLALWRREYAVHFEKEKAKKPMKRKALEPSKLLITPGLVLSVIAVTLVLLFFGYLSYQYRSYSGAPKLEIYTPQNSIVVNSEILDVTGKTDRDSVLLINNQRVLLDKDGSFVTSLKLREGLNTLSFLSVNKLGRETEEIRTIIYRNLEEVIESTESTEAVLIEE
jgi:transcriptional regulator with XRE-family HTH domain